MRQHGSSGTKPVHILTAGRFGDAVGSHLSQIINAAVTAAGQQPDPSRWPVSRMLVLAAWRPMAALGSALDELTHAWNIPFIPCVLESQKLIIGPAIQPGRSACFDCYQRRKLQHSSRAETRRALLREYDARPDCGPEGYLDVFADLAAVRLAQTIQQFDAEPDAVAGMVWQMDLLTRECVTGVVAGVHGCVRCGCQREEQKRGYAGLQSELSWLFKAQQIADKNSRIGEPVSAEITL